MVNGIKWNDSHYIHNTHPDHVVHCVDICVAHVDPNGTERKAVLPPRAVDDHRRTKTAYAEREVTVGGRVPR